MIFDLLIFLSIAVLFLAVGFARQEDRTVTVPLEQSVRIDGTMYHPHSKGREMPIEHALAAGFTKDDFLGEEPEEELEPIPKDTPEYDALILDERFATVEALLENQDQLTDINGIADKTKAKIVEHVKSHKEG